MYFPAFYSLPALLPQTSRPFTDYSPPTSSSCINVCGHSVCPQWDSLLTSGGFTVGQIVNNRDVLSAGVQHSGKGLQYTYMNI